MQSYYSIVGCIPYTVHYIPMTCLFYNWNFVPLNSLHQFHPILHPFPLWWQPVLCIYESVCFVLFVRLLCFLDSTYKWNHTLFVFLWLISLSTILSRSLHVVTNGKISFFFNDWVIFHCVCVCVCVSVYTLHLLYAFIYWWALRLFPCLGYCE